MDKWQAMTRFVRVAELGSFTSAADSLGLPKASISASVSALERQLGTRLLHRSTRRLTLTPDGEEYLQSSRLILAELDNLESRFQREPGQVRGNIRVDMPSRLACQVVLPNLPAFLDTYPGVHITISSHDYQVDLVGEGFDCVVRIGQLSDSSLIARPVAQATMVNCASPAYLKTRGTPVTIDDLDEHLLVQYAQPKSARPDTFDYREKGQLKQKAMTSAISVNGTEAYLSACLAGLGIAQYPVHGVQQYLQSGELVAILPAFQDEPMPVNLVYPSRRQQPARVVLFMDWLEQTIRAEISDSS